MSCATLTLPRLALLAAYLLVIFGIGELHLSNKPLLFLAVGLPMAVTIALWRRTCAVPTEER